MKLLFITWDGPQVHYMEGLFFPIFNEIQIRYPIDFHILQFTWNNREGIQRTQQKANDLGFTYHTEKVYRKPHPMIGSLATIPRGRSVIKDYIQTKNIDTLMPRSTMPAMMVNSITSGLQDVSVVFDADGLPIEERVDFRGLKRGGLQYNVLKGQESKIIKEADSVLTRSEKAIEIHQKNVPESEKDKFHVVKNGRDIDQFKPNNIRRKQVRDRLDVTKDETLFVYCGSLGPQYGVEEMLGIFDQVQSHTGNAKLLILTGNPEYLDGKIPKTHKDTITIDSVPFNRVPEYLNAADIAFAIRKPLYSMQGVAPIKLGEYLLMGLPTIASKGIGDTEKLLEEAPNCFLFTHDENSVEKAADWVVNLENVDRNDIREFGVEHFSLEQSAISYIKVIEAID